MPKAMRRLVRHKETVIPNAVDLRGIDDAIVRTPVDRPPDRGLRVVFVGRLIPIKNARMVIDAIATARVPGIELVIVGDGELRAELEEAVDSTGVRDRTTFTGLVERDEVYRQIAAGDVYVSTSRGEGLPVAVLEAMACRRPAILSDIPPHREITNGTDAVALLDPDDLGGFARELERLAEMSPEERTDLGERCRAIVERRFSLHAMHASYVSVYTRAASRRAAASRRISR
jgi:glycosyltransferase involved in cell wall biosynthesis